jgi:GNAT superfamily N-acetyltransferase
MKINAAKRLQATVGEDGDWRQPIESLGQGELVNAKIGGQPLSDSFGRQQLKRYTTTIFKHAVNNPGLIQQDLGSKDGLNLKLVSDVTDRVLTLDDGQRVVAYGKLEHSPYSKRWRMYNLYVDKDYRGKGLANVLHLGALHVYKHLESDTCMAVGALKAFKAMERFGYKIKMLDTKNGKTVPFKWGADGIPVVEGRSIEDSENYALYI